MSATATLPIEGEFTIYRAAEWHGALVQALAQAQGALTLDLGQVSEMDSAGVQLLMAAKKTARAAGVALHLVGHSPAVLEVFQTLDLAAHFGDPLVLPAAA